VCGPQYSSVEWLPCRLVEVRIEWKRELNVSRALLVLERKILKSIICKCRTAPVEFGSVVSVQNGRGAG